MHTGTYRSHRQTVGTHISLVHIYKYIVDSYVHINIHHRLICTYTNTLTVLVPTLTVGTH